PRPRRATVGGGERRAVRRAEVPVGDDDRGGDESVRIRRMRREVWLDQRGVARGRRQRGVADAQGGGDGGRRGPNSDAEYLPYNNAAQRAARRRRAPHRLPDSFFGAAFEPTA